jgi:hypothetical protein
MHIFKEEEDGGSEEEALLASRSLLAQLLQTFPEVPALLLRQRGILPQQYENIEGIWTTILGLLNTLLPQTILYVVINNLPNPSSGLDVFVQGLQQMCGPETVPAVKIFITTVTPESLRAFPSATVVSAAFAKRPKSPMPKRQLPPPPAGGVLMHRQKQNKKLYQMIMREKIRTSAY